MMRKIFLLAILGAFSVAPATRQTARWEFNDNLDQDIFFQLDFWNAMELHPHLSGLESTAIPFTDFQTEQINGQPARVLRFINNQWGNGYLRARPQLSREDGEGYVNRYSIAMDIRMAPTGGGEPWQALINTENDSTNDADFYTFFEGPSNALTGRLGIEGDFGANFNINGYNRIVITVDTGNLVDGMKFYVNGNLVTARSGGGIDGRWSLYSVYEAGSPWITLFGEGDSSSNYTNPIFLNSLACYDAPLSAAEVAALGGPSASGIPQPVGQRTIGGEANLEAWGGTFNQVPITLQLVQAFNGNIVETVEVLADPNGYYGATFNAWEGFFYVYANAPRFLRQRVAGALFGEGISDAIISFELTNGDVDGDEAVTIFDYIEISSAFDLNFGDPGFVPTADLDGDGTVSIFDYIILSNNFDLSGD